MPPSFRPRLFTVALVSCLLACSIPKQAMALQPLSDFLKGARSQSTEYREASLAAIQRQMDARAAYGHLLPALTATGTYTRNQYEGSVSFPPDNHEIIIQPYNGLTGSLQLSVPIIDVASWDSARASSHLSKASERASKATLAEVQRQVAQAWFQLVSAEAQRRSYERSRASALQNLALTRERRRAGAATDLDEARASVEVDSASRSIADRELDAALARRALTTLTGIVPSPDVDDIQASLSEEPELSNWEQTALSYSPALGSAKAQRRSAEEQSSAANHALFPVLSAALTGQATNTPGFTGHKTYYTATATASWRLDAVLVAQTKGRAAAAESAVVAETRLRQRVLDSVHEAWQRVRTGIAQCRVTRCQASAAALAAKTASDRYAAGTGSQLDLIQAQRDLASAEAARIRADADLLYARVALRLAAGLSPDGASL